jgi:hypothetical protein
MKRVSFVVVACLLVGSSVASAQSDPRIGHWKMNAAKSTFDPGPAPKSDVRSYQATAEGTKVSVQQTPVSGSATTASYTAKLDGKDYPISGSPIFDTISLKRIDDHTIDATLKKGGKVVQTVKAVVSNDGKTMTTTASGTDPNGKPVHNVIVLDKQP